MLMDLIKALADAFTTQEKEKAYKDLERIGMDRRTADYLLTELNKGGSANG